MWSGVPSFFYGDDLLLLASSNGSELGKGYATSFLFGFNDVGSGKWRPAFTTLVPLALQAFGSNYSGYLVVNSLLFLLLVYFLLRLLRVAFGGSRIGIVAVGLAFAINPFSWYSVWSPFGIMELGALVALVIGLQIFLTKQGSPIVSSWIAGSWVLLATLFHERYLICFVALTVVSLARRHSNRFFVLTPLVGLPIVYLATKLFVLKIDPLTGGGETDFRETEGLWIVDHFSSALRAVFGMSDGRIIGFDSTDGLRPVSEGMWQQFLFTGLVALFIGSVAISVFVYSQGHRQESLREGVSRATASRMLLLISTVSLLIPASTVVSRIEGRWLFASQVLVVLFMASLVSHRSALVRDLSLGFVTLTAAWGLVALPHRNEFESTMRLSDRLISIVHEVEPVASPWVLFIRDPNSVGQWEWRLGYGAAFSEMDNPPAAISTALIPCESACLIVDMTNREWKIREENP